MLPRRVQISFQDFRQKKFEHQSKNTARFPFGGILDDKNKNFIVGDSFFLRKLEYSVANDIDEKIIKDFVKQAIGKLDYFKNNWKELNKHSK